MRAASSVPITVQALTLSILTYLIDRADRGEFDGLLGPLDPAEIDRLRTLSVRELLGITDQQRPIVHISIDPRQLRGCMSRLRDRGDAETDQLWFIRRGAQQALMTEVFGTTEREYRALRRLAGVTDRGRPAALKASLAADVRACWHDIETDGLSLIERYRLVGDAFPELALASLYAAIHDER